MIEALRAVAIVVLVAAGLFFTVVSTVGVLRLPDVYARAHTASQADTLGAGLTLAGVALYLGWQPALVETVLLLAFIFVTNPTAAHAIARAAHEEGIVPWTVDDDRDDAELAPDRGDESVASDGGGETDVASDGGTGTDLTPDGGTGTDLTPDGGTGTDPATDRRPETGGEDA